MNTEVTVTNGTLEQNEINAYIEHIKNNNPKRDVEWVKIDVDGDFVNLSYKLADQPFDRIRRVTGYLVGTLDRFNDGKRAEEHDRVKHM